MFPSRSPIGPIGSFPKSVCTTVTPFCFLDNKKSLASVSGKEPLFVPFLCSDAS